MKILAAFLKNKYKKVTVTNSYIMAEGELPICLMAHLDTVFSLPPEEIYYDENQKVMWSPQGLGADDRAGVYSIIQIIEDGYRPSVIFLTDEEIGGIGATQLVKDSAGTFTIENPNSKCPLENLKMILELDRQGKNDCVFYSCENEDFELFLNSMGFITNYGTFSDISIIAPEWGVAAANLSIGYLDEHHAIERLHTDWMYSTIEKVEKILDMITEAPFFEYIQAKETCIWPDDICILCHKELTKDNRHSVEGIDSFGYFKYYLCDDCYNNNIVAQG